LVKQIEDELEHRNSNDVFSTQKDMETSAKSYLDIASKEETNYYNYYKEKFCLISSVNNSEEKTQDVSNDKNSKKERPQTFSSNDDIREKMIAFRKSRSTELKIPAYYVFTNDELEKLLEVKPTTIEDLKNSNILPPIKIKTHGQQIIDVLK
jgi:superfamily II DNA helicase RecQ